MKRILLFIIALNAFLSVYPQTSSISIAVVVPKQEMTLDRNTFSILKNKVSSAMTMNDVSTAMYSGIVLYPTLNVVNQQTVEGGMRKIQVIELELNLNIKQTITETSFSSFSQKFRGEGFSVDEAKRNAISKIDPSSYAFSNFIKTTQGRIIDYYNKNTQVLITKAKSLVSTQQYSEALALLTTYPETLDGYEAVSNTAISIFKQWQIQNCSQLLQRAKGEITLDNIENAIAILTSIDVTSPCGEEASEMIKSVKAHLDKEKEEAIKKEEKERAETLSMLQSEKKAEYELEKLKIKAVKEMAKSYFENQPTYIFNY